MNSKYPAKDQPLRDDVNKLGAIVGDMLREQEGAEFYDLVESVRQQAVNARDGDAGASELLIESISSIPGAQRETLVRAFSAYFDAVNMGEQIHRLRRRRDYERNGPQPNGPEAVLSELKEKGITTDQCAEMLARLRIEPVFTAHPTEAVRRTLLTKQQRIARALVERLEPAALTPKEDDRALARIREEVTSAWQTEEHFSERPSLDDEVEHVLFYLRMVIYRIIPPLMEAWEEAFRKVFGRVPPLEPLVKFGSWVGGDMDGNPNVNARTHRATLRRHREAVLQLYRGEIATLIDHLSQTDTRATFDDEFTRRVRELKVDHRLAGAIPRRHEGMLYQVMLHILDVRLSLTQRDADGGFAGTFEFESDLKLIADSLACNKGGHAGLHRVRRLIRHVQTFGFHFATLDARQDSEVHRRVCGELLGVDLPALEPEQRANRLNEALTDVAAAEPDAEIIDWRGKEHSDQVVSLAEEFSLSVQHLLNMAQAVGMNNLADEWLSEEDEFNLRSMLKQQQARSGDKREQYETLEVFRAIADGRRLYGEQAIGPYIISMAQGPDDVLAVLYLARCAGLVEDAQVPLDVAPLFETVGDLDRARSTLESMLSNEAYREHLRGRGDVQHVMLGYSDSGKDSGIASARWALYRAQEELVQSADAAGVKLVLFHGRGGTVSRGGTKVTEAIPAQPPGSVRARLRVTEQGEIINARYGLRGIAQRTLEVTSGAVLKFSLLEDSLPDPRPEWRAIMDTIATHSRADFRKLVYEDPRFFEYFQLATPLDVITRMRIGSRPASRRQQRGIGDLRAIPWVFAWTQARHILPGWYGLAAGLKQAINDHGLSAVQTAAREWAVLRTLIGDVEMVMAKADFSMAERYAALAGDVGESLFPELQAAFTETGELIREVREVGDLLEHEPWLAKSIRLRNPYIDPMSLLQIQLLKEWREGDRKDTELERALFTTVKGIARGLMNTG
ncbi:MAG: phosphoenolpyruvate carboxylase [Planctomycetota bacterium]